MRVTNAIISEARGSSQNCGRAASYAKNLLACLLGLLILWSTSSSCNAQDNLFDRYLDRSHPIATQFLANAAPGASAHQQGTHSKAVAVADGVVIAIEQNSTPDKPHDRLVIRHVYFENAERKTIYSIYLLDQASSLKIGRIVKSGMELGRFQSEPDAFSLSTSFPKIQSLHTVQTHGFLKSHRRLFNPLEEKHLILVDTETYRLRYLENQQTHELEIGIGQAKGQKQLRGDNKTPRGMYFITHKYKGRFSGPAAAYFGGYWMKLNYPNSFDAERALATGAITQTQANSITSAWQRRAETLQQTPLGGGIGFHAWAYEWNNFGSRHMSWGCVVFHPYDMAKHFESIPVGTMVILF